MSFANRKGKFFYQRKLYINRIVLFFVKPNIANIQFPTFVIREPYLASFQEINVDCTLQKSEVKPQKMKFGVKYVQSLYLPRVHSLLKTRMIVCCTRIIAFSDVVKTIIAKLSQKKLSYFPNSVVLTHTAFNN